MATKIITKNGSGAPSTVQVDKGELAVDLTNKQLYTNDGNAIIKLGGSGSSGEWEVNGNDIYYDKGNVGIGMAPETTTFDLSAKEQLKEWKTKAKKASWPIVTDGAFEQEPTEELVAEWIETRAAGDKLQVAGSGSFSDNVSVGSTGPNSSHYVKLNLRTHIGYDGSGPGVMRLGTTASGGARAIHFDATSENSSDVIIDSTGNVGINQSDPSSLLSISADYHASNSTSANIALRGRYNGNWYNNGIWSSGTNLKFSTGTLGISGPSEADTALTIDGTGDATFSGTVNAKVFANGGPGIFINASGQIIPVDKDGNFLNGSATHDIGVDTQPFQNATFSGAVTAGKFAGPLVGNNSIGGCYWYSNKLIPCTTDVVNSDNTHDLGQTGSGATQIRWRNAYFSGTVNSATSRSDLIIQDGAPVVDSLQIIRAFMKLRDAVDDPDSTVEELRDKLKVAVVDIIDQFQDQIDTMPDLETPVVMPSPEEPVVMPSPEEPVVMPSPTDLPE